MMTPLHHNLFQASAIEVTLLLVLVFAFSCLVIFALCWFKFKIWSGTKLGQTALVINFALMLLCAIEILDALHVHFGGFGRIVGWIIISVVVIMRTVFMLQGRSSYSKENGGEDNGRTS